MEEFFEELKYTPLGGYILLLIMGLVVVGLIITAAAVLIIKRQSRKVVSDGKK